MSKVWIGLIGISIGAAQAEPVALCEKSADYAIYLSGIRTGEMHRVERWQGQSATVSSQSHASILGIGTRYDQTATLVWSEASQSWLTTSFHQKVSGFRSRDMSVDFSSDGTQTRVNLDGQIHHYDNGEAPLRDVDTLSIQIRQHIKNGEQRFSLTRQASDGPEPYQYQVLSPTHISVGVWGEIAVIPVEQTGEERITFWYAPSLDYQLVKARYHGFLLQGSAELQHFHNGCGRSS